MAKEIKKLMAAEVRADLATSPNLLVLTLVRMDAEADATLRNDLRGLGARMRVVHNRTSRHALDEARKGLAELFTGQTALTLIPGEDPDLVQIAKTLVTAARKKTLQVRGGYIDGEVVDRAGVELLARSPDKQTLRGMLLSATMGSARGIACAIQAVGGGLARCLQERIDLTGSEPDES